MSSASEAIQAQISSCLQALDLLNRAVRGRNPQRLIKADRKLFEQMERLQQIVEGISLDDELIAQMRQLNIRVRRTQRQLSSQITAVESDVESLEKGMRKVSMIREALEKD